MVLWGIDCIRVVEVMLEELLAEGTEAEDIVFFLMPLNDGSGGNCNMRVRVFRCRRASNLEWSIETFVGDGVPSRVGSLMNKAPGFERVPNVFNGLVVLGI